MRVAADADDMASWTGNGGTPMIPLPRRIEVERRRCAFLSRLCEVKWCSEASTPGKARPPTCYFSHTFG